MNKGFTLCREALDKQNGDFTYGLKTLGKILMMKIGGSMGPLYGKFFLSIGKALEGVGEIGRDEFGQALRAALDAVPGRKVVIVDACYSGSLAEVNAASTDSAAGGTMDDFNASEELNIEYYD